MSNCSRTWCKKLALYKSSLGSEADAERLIATSQAEIDRIRQQTQTDLEEVNREVEEARRELRIATDQYRQLRRELDRLQPELAAQFAAEDRLLWDAEAHFPGGQLQLLAHEVEAGLNAFRLAEQARAICTTQGLDRPLPVLPGLPGPRSRVDRRAPGAIAPGLPPAQVAYRGSTSRAISRRSARTSRPTGRRYVAEAQEQLVQAIEAGRRARDAERNRTVTASPAIDQPASSGEDGLGTLRDAISNELRLVAADGRCPMMTHEFGCAYPAIRQNMVMFGGGWRGGCAEVVNF